MTNYGQTSVWSYVQDPNDPEGGYYQATITIPVAGYSNVQVKVTGVKPSPEPPFTYMTPTARTTGITISP
jgi:hypothetical protein